MASAEETFERNLIGNNTGNLIFSQAVYRLLSRADHELTTDGLRRGKPKKISAEYDHVVVPLANAFRPNYVDRLDAMSEIFEKLTIPVTVLGVGAQADLDGNQKRASLLDPSVRRFVRAVLDRSGSIGVRGEFTKDYLTDLGFSDDEVQVIGCPSMFMYGPNLKIEKRVPTLTADSPIALNISPYVKEMGPISLRQAARYPHLVYQAQNIQTLELLLHGTYPMGKKSPTRTSGVPVTLDHPLIREDRVRFFLDPRTWFEHLARYDFSFGTRIHGTIAALLAGTPAVLLAHDSRTLELANHHQIPFRTIRELPEDVDAAQLYAEADWEPLNRAQAENWANFAAFLDRQGLNHVYADGDDGAQFDQDLAAVDLPPAVGTLMGATPEELYAMKRELLDLRKASSIGPMPTSELIDEVVSRARTKVRRATRRNPKLAK